MGILQDFANAQAVNEALKKGVAAHEGIETLETDISSLKAQGVQQTPLFAESVEWLNENGDTSKVYVLPDGYIYGYTTITAEVAPYTNVVPASIDTDGAIFNGTGYKEGYRLNSSGAETVSSSAVCSGFIPFTKGDIIYIFSDASVANSGNANHYFDTYDDSFTKLSVNGGSNIGTWSEFEGRSMWAVDTSVLTVTPTYFRCSTVGNGANFIVSVNEPLNAEKEVVTINTWANTGHAFISTNTASDTVPSYVVNEAVEVADKVLSIRNADSFVMALASDFHTNSKDTSSVGVLHAGQGIDEINSLTQIDLVALLGDYEIYGFSYGETDTDEEDARDSFKHVRKSFSSVSKNVPVMWLQGNHDELSADTTESARQKYYAYIGANNVGTITDYDNKYRNYGYRDFENYKIRVIYLNTTDVSDAEVTGSYNVSDEQLNWLNTVALNLDKSDWGIIVLSHHPLNWNGTELLDALDTYKSNDSGAELIAHFHGHLHNFRAETLGVNSIPSITVPNACFGRNNEYGMSSSYDDDIKNKFGDTDASGSQRQFNKTENTAEDTAFNVVVVDRQTRKIHCFNYGAGIDREISY